MPVACVRVQLARAKAVKAIADMAISFSVVLMIGEKVLFIVLDRKGHSHRWQAHRLRTVTWRRSRRTGC